MITKSELIEYLKHTPENTNYNILYSSLYNGSNKETVDEFIEVLSRGNLSLAALQPYLAKLYEDDKTISPEPLPPFSVGDDIQPDWAQNDETKPDYIKNRTHWMEPGIVTIIPEQTCVGEYEELDEDLGIHCWHPEEGPVFAYPLVEGKTYTVIFDGITYECVAFEYNGICIGDLNVYYGEPNPDFPFLFQGTNTYLMDNIPHTISCTLDDYIYHKLPPEYLANGLNRIIVHQDTKMTIEQVDKYHELLVGGHINLIWGDLCINYIYFEREVDDDGNWTIKNLVLDTRGFKYIINITDDFVFPYKGLRLREMQIISDLDEHIHGFNINMEDEILTIGPFSHFIAPATEKVLFCVEPDGSENSQNFEVLGNGTIKTRSVILPSTTAGSTKKFRITVDDSGTISATEVT